MCLLNEKFQLGVYGFPTSRKSEACD